MSPENTCWSKFNTDRRKFSMKVSSLLSGGSDRTRSEIRNCLRIITFHNRRSGRTPFQRREELHASQFHSPLLLQRARQNASLEAMACLYI
mmetsp:Transcript_17736/g.23482  ORF Transcript_17736/g.23482 Transcript_17736/m.23482 type:complete len:91 (-) Transcript_17736:24-296(-)